MAATLCILVLMVLAASCLYEAFVYLAVKTEKAPFVGPVKTKDKVLAMGRKARQGKATLFIVLAIVCFVLMIVAGILMAPRRIQRVSGKPSANMMGGRRAYRSHAAHPFVFLSGE